MTGLSGQPLAPVSLSPTREKERDLTILGIYGPTYFPSYEFAGPPTSWENRLAVRLGMIGSTECTMTWRRKVTPRGRVIYRLAPLTARNKETEYIGSPGETALWPAATSEGFEIQDVPLLLARRERLKQKHGNNGFGLTLPQSMSLALWSTARASDGEKGGPHQIYSGGGVPLPAQMHRALWAIPTARDYRSGKASPETHAKNSRPLSEQMTPPSGGSMKNTTGPSAMTRSGVVPNPEHPCWLMGLPVEYLCGTDWATRYTRGSPKRSSGPGSKQKVTAFDRLRVAQAILLLSSRATEPPDAC